MGLNTAEIVILALTVIAATAAVGILTWDLVRFFRRSDPDPFDPDKDEIMARIVKRIEEEK